MNRTRPRRIPTVLTAKGDGPDCTQVDCAVVTRVDHRGSGDRSQDVRVPVTFGGQEPGEGDGGDGASTSPCASTTATANCPHPASAAST
ncbi:hypothetical protein [Streptomyces cavernae]|uniref:hypothetical protein n=1 Tax=Streptomyces cavernae TaxID=2259034 RepID=UPI001390ECFD|nr:hypothetical protein [Streptomyces cavernae]